MVLLSVESNIVEIYIVTYASENVQCMFKGSTST